MEANTPTNAKKLTNKWIEAHQHMVGNPPTYGENTHHMVVNTPINVRKYRKMTGNIPISVRKYTSRW